MINTKTIETKETQEKENREISLKRREKQNKSAEKINFLSKT